MTIWNSLGYKIRSERKKSDKTLKDVSQVCGLSVSYLSDIENGRRKPSLDSLEKILEYCSVFKLCLLASLPIV